MGSSAHCYRKEMFRIPQSFKIQEGYIKSHHQHPPVVQDQVEVEVGQQLRHRSVNLYREEAIGSSSFLYLQRFEMKCLQCPESNILSSRTFVCFKSSILNYYHSIEWTTSFSLVTCISEKNTTLILIQFHLSTSEHHLSTLEQYVFRKRWRHCLNRVHAKLLHAQASRSNSRIEFMNRGSTKPVSLS